MVAVLNALMLIQVRKTIGCTCRPVNTPIRIATVLVEEAMMFLGLIECHGRRIAK